MSGMMALAILGSGLVQVTETFTTSQTWTAPANTTNIISMTGKGQDGDPPSYTPGTMTLIQVYNAPGSGGTSQVTNADMVVYANGQFSSGGFAGTGNRSASYTRADLGKDTTGYIVDYYSDGGDITGAATLHNVASNGSPASGQCYVSVSMASGGTIGSNTTGFGKTWPGGNSGPATPATYTNVAVTPGIGYLLNVPAGGSISITYMR